MRPRSCVKDRVYRQHAGDERPVLAFINYSGLGDLLMALPFLQLLRSHFYTLPLISSSHEDLAQLLHQDNLLEDYLVVDKSLIFRKHPLAHAKLCCVNADLKLTHFYSERRLKSDTPPLHLPTV